MTKPIRPHFEFILYTGLPTKNETLKTTQDMTILSLIFMHLIEFLDGLLNNK